jgi:oligosaccharide reducing-end xylanase
MSPGPVARRFGCLTVLVGLVPSCGSTLDSLGCTEHALDGPPGLDGGVALTSLLGPASYPNAFRELLGKTDEEIAAKVATSFGQLFHGDPDREAIFFPTGTDQAYILDVLHNQVRSEGIGLGMLIAVQLDKREEFDQLWRYAKANRVADGPARGYFPSYCDGTNGDVECHDPYGFQQIATALLLARGRWQASPGAIDYGREAGGLLDLARNKETYNCGVVDGVTSIFDAATGLPYNTPTTASAGVSRPSIVMPAYYELWQQATGDAFWSEAAAAGRAYWQASAHPSTGLVPERAAFDGTPVPDFDTFASESHRTFFNMALDRIWTGHQPWVVDESNRVLRFFYDQGIASYGQEYSLDGTELASLHDMTLVAANGALALAATTERRAEFVREVWNLETPAGGSRYYAGIMQLLGVVVLSGQMRVY